MLSSVKKIAATIKERREIASETLELTLSLEQPLYFEAGQYVWLALPNLISSDERGNQRALSVTSSPRQKETIKLIARISGSGYKKTLAELTPGVAVSLRGPFGSAFALPGDEVKKLVYIAGGVGVAPFLSAIRFLRDEGTDKEVWLFFINVSSEREFYREELEALDRANSWFHFVRAVGESASTELDKLSELSGARWYVSGTQEMVDATYNLLKRYGVERQNIRFEQFYPTEEIAKGTDYVKSLIDSPGYNIYKSAIENSSQHVIITDRNGVILYANSAAERITGYSLSEMKGNTPRLWGALMPAEFYQNLWQLKLSGESFVGEITNQRKNGQTYTVVLHISSIFDADKSIIGFLSTEEDISAIGDITRQLVESEDRLKLATESAKIGVWELDIANNQMLWDDLLYQLYGVDKNQVTNIYDVWLKSVHQDDVKVFNDQVQGAIRGNKLFQADFRVVWSDKSIHHLRSYATVENDGKGQATKMIGVTWDITQEEKYRQILKQFEAIIRDTGDAIIAESVDGIIESWNEGAKNLYGFTAEEAVGQKAEIIMPDKSRDFKEIMEVVAQGKRLIDHQTVRKHKNGTLIDVSVTVSPIMSDDDKPMGISIIARDIRKERAIDKAKTEFVSLASHQLRTPLSSINWYAEMLLAGDAGQLNEEQKQYLDEIYQGNQRMVALVNALLNVSRLELGTFAVDLEPIKMAILSREVVEEARPMIFKKKIEVVEKYSDDLPIIQVDSKLLHMIFQNLLSNALKYTPEQGRVEIELRVVSVGENIAGKKINKDSILYSLSDNGYGIPQDQQDKIFQKLFRAYNVREKETEGTGLGLYIVKAIIDHSNGLIWFESEENKGTKFYVTIPLEGMPQKEGHKSLT